MSGRPAGQEYMRRPSGGRRPVHTPRLGAACICGGCVKRRWWTPERRAAKGAQIRAQYADGRRAVQYDLNEKRAEHWRPEEDALVRSLAPDHDCLTIGRLLGERLGKPRTEVAVKHRCRILGISRMDIRPFTASEVGRIFGGISRETVRTKLVLTGLLTGTLRRGGPHGMRMFSRRELEALIREHPEAYDVRTIRDSALKALAEAVSRGRRLLPTSEVARLTSVNPRTLAMWCLKGRVPTARFVQGVRPGRGGVWLIEAGDVDLVRQFRTGRSAARASQADTRRDPMTGAYLGAGEVPSPTLRFRLRIVDRAEAIGRLLPDQVAL